MVDLDVHLEAIRAGDAVAFGHWVAGAECRLRLSLRSFAQHVDVEAMTQEALLRVWQVAPRFEPDGRPDGLLRLAIRTARNLAISEVRRRKPSSLDPSLIESVMRLEDVAIPQVETDPLLREALKRCHEKLPTKQRSVLACRMESAGGQPDRDLADGLGMTLNTFLQNFSRARRLLVECLRKVGISPLAEAP
jgi:RNA polymerase sigma-70 factor (ECF subfamily)